MSIPPPHDNNQNGPRPIPIGEQPTKRCEKESEGPCHPMRGWSVRRASLGSPPAGAGAPDVRVLGVSEMVLGSWGRPLCAYHGAKRTQPRQTGECYATRMALSPSQLAYDVAEPSATGDGHGAEPPASGATWAHAVRQPWQKGAHAMAKTRAIVPSRCRRFDARWRTDWLSLAHLFHRKASSRAGRCASAEG